MAYLNISLYFVSKSYSIVLWFDKYEKSNVKLVSFKISSILTAVSSFNIIFFFPFLRLYFWA